MTAASIHATFRPEVQGLRALAVGLVVVFHFWPSAASGGYVGVDVFFVISGFLITSHLIRESVATGTIRLARFWWRRARRLLPAAMLVLAVTAVGFALVGPGTLLHQTAVESLAAGGYVNNWLQAFRSVDYFAEDSPPTPVQHYWSLSVEEQFYVVWPLLILLLVYLARRRGRSDRRYLGTGLTFVLVAGLAFSIVHTYQDRAFAYFSTLTHVWEFAAGALVALNWDSRVLTGWRTNRVVRASLSNVGLAAVVVAGLTFDATTIFPGYVALLPVLGTLAVIVAGLPTDFAEPARLLVLRPVTWIGDISYSLYLWHWPVVVVLPYVLGRATSGGALALALAVTVALAALTERYVERPLRLGGGGPARNGLFLGAVLGLAVVLVAASVWMLTAGERRLAEGARLSAEVDVLVAGRDLECVGAGAFDADCGDPFALRPGAWPEYAVEDGQNQWIDSRAQDNPFYVWRCTPIGGTESEECRIGAAEPSLTVAVVGDSHVKHYLRPLLTIAHERNWELVMYSVSSCRPAIQSYESHIEREVAQDCQVWKETVLTDLPAMGEIDVIVTSGASRRYHYTEPTDTTDEIAAAFAETWRIWTDQGIPVVALSDVPLAWEHDVPECLDQHLADPAACSLPRSDAAPRDPIVVAASAHPNPDVVLIDTTEIMCDESWCHFVVGGLITHKDTNHLTSTFAVTLTPRLAAALDEALG